MLKKIFALILSLSIITSILGTTGVSAASVDPEAVVAQIVRSTVPTDPEVPADLFVQSVVPTNKENILDFISPFKDIDTPLNGGYAYSRYYAAGGRVDIDVHFLFLNPMDARAYATKSEQSLLEGVAWFGASFIPVVGPYLSTLGLLKTAVDATFVADIRKYADKDQSVQIIITHDKWYGMTYRAVAYWNGLKDTVRSDTSLNQDYKISSYVNYKY